MATKRGPTSSPNNNSKISYRCEARHDTAVGSRPAGVDDTIHSSTDVEHGSLELVERAIVDSWRAGRFVWDSIPSCWISCCWQLGNSSPQLPSRKEKYIMHSVFHYFYSIYKKLGIYLFHLHCIYFSVLRGRNAFISAPALLCYPYFGQCCGGRSFFWQRLRLSSHNFIVIPMPQ